MPMGDKTITGYLVVDWRDGSHRTRKSKPSASELGTNELLAELNIDVHVPEVDVPTLAAEIDVPEPRVHAATLDALDEDDLPDWTDVADDVIESNGARIQRDASSDIDDIVNALVGETMLEVDTHPDPELVRDYIRDVVEPMRAEAMGGPDA